MQPAPDALPSAPGLSERLCRFLAGLDTGLAGAVVVISWLLFHSWLTGDFWWAKLNVAGALFYGNSAYTMGLSRASAAGAALLLIVYASLGGLLGLLTRPRGFTRDLLVGMLVAMAWHLFAQRFFWRRLDPFGPAYFPVLATLPAHLIFGISLSRYAARFYHVAATFGNSVWSIPLLQSLQPPVTTEEAAEDTPAEMPQTTSQRPHTEAPDGSPAPLEMEPEAPPLFPPTPEPGTVAREETNPPPKSDC